jgi:hypothetical protein
MLVDAGVDKDSNTGGAGDGAVYIRRRSLRVRLYAVGKLHGCMKPDVSAGIWGEAFAHVPRGAAQKLVHIA